jgi:pimeloyl-ACP methyl ester carboxylesterase
MATTEKPVIVLVHGAWHHPHYYRRLIDPLREQGYVVLAPPMASTGPDDSVAGKTWVDDVRRIHEVMLPHLDEGREAIVVCHSQGGIAGSASIEGQSVAERKALGLKGGVRAVIYIAAFALPERGLSLFAAVGSKVPYFFNEYVGAFWVSCGVQRGICCFVENDLSANGKRIHRVHSTNSMRGPGKRSTEIYPRKRPRRC